ncbi:MAG: YjjG family noncanonical pyrimidine nucleotidase [Bacteroidales bacterium]|jgi:putative hydrolase of the HAD superfamily|nr:YjjG family noncanonical pyrimidine nucleotidase [Bacteroidales bacterium]
MTKYKHIFIDLDKTLWDFDANALITLGELFDTYQLKEKGIENFDCFLTFYKAYNHTLWEKYRKGEINKAVLSVERFNGSLKNFGIDDFDIAKKMALDYIRISPTKTKLYPNAIEVVTELSMKYSLHIITNGFSEVQFIKVKNSGLSPYFETIITSEMIGVQKPDPKIFLFSLGKTSAKIGEALMIGDDLEADILGAQKIGMDQIYVNFEKKPHANLPLYEVNNLLEILDIL